MTENLRSVDHDDPAAEMAAMKIHSLSIRSMEVVVLRL
jgi:hypothetical protein